MADTENLQSLQYIQSRLQDFIDESPRFTPLSSGLGGHGHTVLGHFLKTSESVLSFSLAEEKIVLPLPDGDQLTGALYRPMKGLKPKGLVHIFHGLAGSVESKYMPRAAYACCEIGFAAVLWNHRGCGNGRGRAIGTYHSGRSDDQSRTIRWGRNEFPQLPQIVIGYSLSGNAAILLSAGIVPAVSRSPLSRGDFAARLNGDLPDFAIAVNPPLDLRKSALRLSQKVSRIYGQRFMFDLLECLDDRLNIGDEFQKSDTQKELKSIAQTAKHQLRVWNSVFEFDRHYTGQAAGFADHLDYYARASSGPALGRQQIPLVVLTAEDDPITSGIADLQETRAFTLDLQKHGGHMGYVDKTVIALKSPAPLRWMERRLQSYLTQYLKLAPQAV